MNQLIALLLLIVAVGKVKAVFAFNIQPGTELFTKLHLTAHVELVAGGMCLLATALVLKTAVAQYVKILNFCFQQTDTGE